MMAALAALAWLAMAWSAGGDLKVHPTGAEIAARSQRDRGDFAVIVPWLKRAGYRWINAADSAGPQPPGGGRCLQAVRGGLWSPLDVVRVCDDGTGIVHGVWIRQGRAGDWERLETGK